MSMQTIARSRWASWFCLFVVSMTGAFWFGRNPRPVMGVPDLNTRPDIPKIEIELIPSLVNARELVPIELAPDAAISSNLMPQWNAQPQWRSEIIGTLSRPESPTQIPTPIPEVFPLTPREKKEPPTLGNALANSTTIESQFKNRSIQAPNLNSHLSSLPFENNLLGLRSASQELIPSNQMTVNLRSEWPDQNFSPAQALVEKPLALTPLKTPNLLTGSVMRPQIKPQQVNNQPGMPIEPMQSVPVKAPPVPRTGNYILQPLRNNGAQ